MKQSKIKHFMIIQYANQIHNNPFSRMQQLGLHVLAFVRLRQPLLLYELDKQLSN